MAKSLRKERVSDEILQLLGEQFSAGRLNDPRLEGVSLTHVKISADLQMASVYFRCLNKDHQQQAVEGLERSKGFLRNILAKGLRLRRVPELRFFFDESVETGSRVESLLAGLREP